MDGLLCLRSATTSFWHSDAVRGPSTPTAPAPRGPTVINNQIAKRAPSRHDDAHPSRSGRQGAIWLSVARNDIIDQRADFRVELPGRKVDRIEVARHRPPAAQGKRHDLLAQPLVNETFGDIAHPEPACDGYAPELDFTDAGTDPLRVERHHLAGLLEDPGAQGRNDHRRNIRQAFGVIEVEKLGHPVDQRPSGAEHAAYGPQPSRHMPAVAQGAKLEGNVDPFLDKIGLGIGQAQIEGKLGMRFGKSQQEQRPASSADDRRRGDRNPAAQDVAIALYGLAGHIDFTKRCEAAREQHLPLCRQADGARRAPQKRRSQSGLKPGKPAADRAHWQFEPLGGTPEAPFPRDGHEYSQIIIEQCHCPISAIMFSKSAQLFRFLTGRIFARLNAMEIFEMTTATEHAGPLSNPVARSAGLAMGLLALAQLVISVDYNIIYVALPHIGQQLGFSAQSLQWVVSGYAIGFGGLLLLGGRAVDRLGARRIFMAALVLYALASFAGGLATSPEMLVGARIVQGIGSALLFPATLSIVSIRFAEGPERNRAMAMWGTAGASGVILGAAGGGLLTSTFGWESVFFAKVPLALLALLGAAALLPKDSHPEFGRFDLPGALLATAGATMLVYGLIRAPEAGWTSPEGLGAIVAGLGFIGLFLARERKAKEPLAPLSLFTHRWLVLAMLTLFIMQGTINAAHYIAFLFMETGLGFDALWSGLGFLPVTFLAIFGSAKLLPLLLAKLGLRKALIVGTAGFATALALQGIALNDAGTYWHLLPALAVWGLTAGMVYPAMFLAATTGTPSNQQGVASAIASTAGQIGGAVGLAILVAIANAGIDSSVLATTSAEDIVAGLRTASYWGAGITLAATLLLFLVRMPGDRQ